MTLRVLYLDVNSFFATVEQQENPRLRGRPVAVVPVLTGSTCCLAASYQAKRFGIKTGTSVSEALRLCPDLQVVVSRPDMYVHYHHHIIKTVESCVPVRKVWSIDEMEIRLLGEERQPLRAAALAREIKARLRREVGECVTCSIGVAPNRPLAKLGTDMQKPDGLVILQERDLPGRIAELSVRELAGIGPRMEARLWRRGIATIGRLYECSEAEMVRLWGGVGGRYWWHWLRGADVEGPATRTRSIGHEHVLEPELRTPQGVRAVMTRLIHKAAARLRQSGYRAGALAVHVSFVEGGAWEDALHLCPPCQETLRLLEAWATLWQRGPWGRVPTSPQGNRDDGAVSGGGAGGGWLAGSGGPLKVGMHLYHLEPVHAGTLPLFTQQHHAEALSRVMDKVNARFGPNALHTGGMHDVCDASPARIAFSSVPDMTLA